MAFESNWLAAAPCGKSGIQFQAQLVSGHLVPRPHADTHPTFQQFLTNHAQLAVESQCRSSNDCCCLRVLCNLYVYTLQYQAISTHTKCMYIKPGRVASFQNKLFPLGVSPRTSTTKTADWQVPPFLTSTCESIGLLF